MKEKVFEAPRDHQWVLKKQRPTQFGDRKHRVNDKFTPIPIEDLEKALPAAINNVMDEHVVKVLKQSEEGRELLKERN